MENSEQDSLGGERDGVVTARGTGDGLVIRLDGSVNPLDLREALADFLASRRSFLGGNEVALEWIGVAPEQAMVDALSDFLRKDFQITVKESRFRDLRRAGDLVAGASPGSKGSSYTSNHYLTSDRASSPIVSVRSLKATSDVDRTSRESKDSLGQHQTGKGFGRKSRGFGASQSAADASSIKDSLSNDVSSDDFEDSLGGWSERGKKVSLFDGIDVMNIPDDGGDTSSRTYSGAESTSRERTKAVNPLLWDDPDARIINMTLRSGQKVESDHSIIVRGDVNSGAEVIAGGDIIVLGTLRGIAHAGAFDDTGGGRSIVALSLQPTQLRIGSLISRGKNDSGTSDGGQGIEIARIEGNIIAVEPYQVRGSNRRG